MLNLYLNQTKYSVRLLFSGQYKLFIAGLLLCSSMSVLASPAFWQLEYQGKRSWLLGTIHVAKNQVQLSPLVQNKLTLAERLIVEVNLNQVNPLTMQQMIAPYIMSKNSLPLHLQSKIDDVLDELNFEFSYSVKMQPWMINLQLIQQYMTSQGYHAHYGIDQALLDNFSATNKAIISLETIEQQLALFYKQDDQGLRWLEESLVQATDERFSIHTLYAAWQNGDINKLNHIIDLTNDLSLSSKKMQYAMLGKRNKNWILKLMKAIKKDRSFIAVGALHMAGDDSVINLLLSQGVVITRLE